MAERPKPPDAWPHWLLHRADQATVAVAVLLGLGSVVAWWLVQGGAGARLIEIDRGPPQTAEFRVDINAAEWPELAALPSIGRSMAEKIVANRHAQGPFTDLEDLRRVRGIGPKTLETIRPYLRPMPPGRAVADR